MKPLRALRAMVVLATAVVAAASSASQAQAPDTRHVVVISIDGLKPTTYTADGPSKVPTLRGLAREGAYAEGVIGVTPTVTYPSHTTMMTGVPPAIHGIYNNRILDPEEVSNASWYLVWARHSGPDASSRGQGSRSANRCSQLAGNCRRRHRLPHAGIRRRHPPSQVAGPHSRDLGSSRSARQLRTPGEAAGVAADRRRSSPALPPGSFALTARS